MCVANVAGLAEMKIIEFIGLKLINSQRHIATHPFDQRLRSAFMIGLGPSGCKTFEEELEAVGSSDGPPEGEW